MILRKMSVMVLGVFCAGYSATAATVSITADNLGDPTQLDFQNGHTVTDFGGFTGLTLTITSTGNHDTSMSPNIEGGSFRNSIPTANANSEAGYIFSFNGNGLVEVRGLTVSSENNIFARNVSSTGFQVRERVSADISGGIWDSIEANPGGNAGQLQINGEGSSDAVVSINLPNQNQAAFDTEGFTAVASGASITELVYNYDLALVTNGGQAPATLATNQPFFVTLDVELVPEPSSSFLMALSFFAFCLHRKRV